MISMHLQDTPGRGFLTVLLAVLVLDVLGGVDAPLLQHLQQHLLAGDVQMRVLLHRLLLRLLLIQALKHIHNSDAHFIGKYMYIQ